MKFVIVQVHVKASEIKLSWWWWRNPDRIRSRTESDQVLILSRGWISSAEARLRKRMLRTRQFMINTTINILQRILYSSLGISVSSLSSLRGAKLISWWKFWRGVRQKQISPTHARKIPYLNGVILGDITFTGPMRWKNECGYKCAHLLGGGGGVFSFWKGAPMSTFIDMLPYLYFAKAT